MNNQYSEKDPAYYSVHRHDIIEFIPKNLKTVLDVGCSNGSFGEMLKKQFDVTEVWGIEPFKESAIEASGKLDKVFDVPVETALEELKDKKFDCIFFNDVLEHLTDPYTVLATVKKNLNPNGYLFASIPNILQLENIYRIIKTMDWKYEEHGIMDKTHLRFFTKKSIERMFIEAGYKINFIKGINPKVAKKFKLIKLLFGRNKAESLKYIQFVVLAEIK